MFERSVLQLIFQVTAFHELEKSTLQQLFHNVLDLMQYYIEVTIE